MTKKTKLLHNQIFFLLGALLNACTYIFQNLFLDFIGINWTSIAVLELPDLFFKCENRFTRTWSCKDYQTQFLWDPLDGKKSSNLKTFDTLLHCPANQNDNADNSLLK